MNLLCKVFMKERKSIKRQQILDSAKTLFWKHGLKRVTVEEVCLNAQVSKMTFYKFFNNKHLLAMEVMRIEMERALSEYKALIVSDMPYSEKINTLLQMKLEGVRGISQEFLMDIYKRPGSDLKKYMEEMAQKSMKLSLDFFRDSQSKGFIRKDIDFDFMLYYLNQATQMIQDEDLVSKYKKPEDLIMEVTRFFFYGIGLKQEI